MSPQHGFWKPVSGLIGARLTKPSLQSSTLYFDAVSHWMRNSRWWLPHRLICLYFLYPHSQHLGLQDCVPVLGFLMWVKRIWTQLLGNFAAKPSPIPSNLFICNLKGWMGEMVQAYKGLAWKCDHLSLMPKSQQREERTRPRSHPLTSTSECHAHTQPET